MKIRFPDPSPTAQDDPAPETAQDVKIGKSQNNSGAFVSTVAKKKMKNKANFAKGEIGLCSLKTRYYVDF